MNLNFLVHSFVDRKTLKFNCEQRKENPNKFMNSPKGFLAQHDGS